MSQSRFQNMRTTLPAGLAMNPQSPAMLFTLPIILIVVLLLLIKVMRRYDMHKEIHRRNAGKRHSKLEKAQPLPIRSYPPVEPLPEFDWETTEPLKHRPFKPKYHLTMSLENATVSQLIEMDKNYVERIMLRRRIMGENPEIALAATDAAKPAVDELYTWLLSIYLPTRFPNMFRLVDTPTSAGGLVEDDLLFLLPSEDGDGYRLRAFVTCFPNGFNTSKKLNLKLRDIHTPVPGYKEKLEKSMDRWFDRLEVGKFVRRYNWTITTTDQLFTHTGNHMYEGEIPQQVDVDIDKARVRSERQMVHRLPQSRAILFSFKTYLYTLSDIKAEGLGEQLAEAIDGLRDGSVPGMHVYKKGAVWGESVKRYLRE